MKNLFKKFVIAYDHRVDKKYINKIEEVLTENKIEFETLDDENAQNDYPILAKKAYEKMKNVVGAGLILLCGTGIGMAVVANKFNGIRGVLATCEAEAYFARRHENANALIFGVGYADENYELKLCRRKMGRMVNVFVTTEFEGDRHIRRLDQITQIEKGK